MGKIQVDFDKMCGKIKPMHAVNNVPEVPKTREKIYEYLTAAKIPYVRLHDTGGHFGCGRYVDIANIFPCFDADENDPASYDFAFTDVLLDDMSSHGMKPFYRLGACIENSHKIKAYNIYPPADNEKWARICEHIIMHYNEGWANGYHMGIEHWEIWCEPDNEPVVDDSPLWRGTKEQYFELYKVTSLYLKKRFPNLKFGGYSSCGFYALSGADFSKVANSSPRTEYFVEFFIDFLEFVRDNKLPFDFFSWHSYAGIKDNVGWAKYAKEKLTEYGFGNTEVYLNEWNTGIEDRGTQKDASNILSMMCAMQNTSTDMCMYYTLSYYSSYCGLINPVHYQIFNAYYAFYYFGRLYGLENQTQCEVTGEDIYALSATNGGEAGVTIANNKNEEICIDLCVKGADLADAKMYVTNDELANEQASYDGGNITIPPYGIVYLEWTK